ncbi:hypothetical protein ADK70_32000 [Streptomyces rimosus subsp. pseudoverticillatus]|uniref:hypothetical protein n=1 Tax=Streptomyces rimosus TaxID=1927 RepID=UPI0006B2A746|nr:hypothetical protein [Streptomyces rimosus]KOT79129.1 hypothetical protein ADK70_32000 [Streptomyces rimosus subsp. pseudoverticillatus]
MTSPAAAIECSGRCWPDDDALVLTNRPLRPGTDLRRLSRFHDDRWSFNAAIFEEHASSKIVNFAVIPAPYRPAAKHYLWQLLNHPDPRPVPYARKGRICLTTIYEGLQPVLSWFTEWGVIALDDVTPALLEDFLAAMEEREVPLDSRYRQIKEIRRLWANRDLLPPAMRLPDTPPWWGDSTQDLLGRSRNGAENRTPRIGELTMQMLLLWAVRFVDDFSTDILAAHHEANELRSRSPEARRADGAGRTAPSAPERVLEQVTAYLDGLRRRSEPLPGYRDAGGQRRICWSFIRSLANAASSSSGFKDSRAGRLVQQSGLPIGTCCALQAPITGLLGGQPWRNRPIGYHEAPRLARLLSTACFIVIAYLSGARAGEVLNLRRGCVGHDEATGLWLMQGLYFKGAQDAAGQKIPEGQLREDPWVVIDLVARAVTVLEHLHPSPLIFANRIIAYNKNPEVWLRQGNARSTTSIRLDLTDFTAWVNHECQQRGRPDRIPADGRGALTASRFRRTLAWHIRRRPRGLIAATRQYGHTHVQMLQGYAGSYASGFPDEYAFEDWLYRIECLAEDADALSDGEHVSGPAAVLYRQRVPAGAREFAGHVVTSDRQARNLLANPLLNIHHGSGMTCVFNPATAACQICGTAGDPMVTPDIDDCRPKCPNIARTDRDIEAARHKASELAETVNDPLSPPLRHTRERHELNRLQTIIRDHETSRAFT